MATSTSRVEPNRIASHAGIIARGMPHTFAKSSPELLTLKLRYKAPDSDTSKLMTMTVGDESGPFATATDNLRFAASVAELGMLLRNSPYKGQSSFGQAREIAQKSLGRDIEGYRHDFLAMISMAEGVPNSEEVAAR